jgi:hypothetical protein
MNPRFSKARTTFPAKGNFFFKEAADKVRRSRNASTCAA